MLPPEVPYLLAGGRQAARRACFGPLPLYAVPLSLHLAPVWRTRASGGCGIIQLCVEKESTPFVKKKGARGALYLPPHTMLTGRVFRLGADVPDWCEPCIRDLGADVTNVDSTDYDFFVASFRTACTVAAPSALIVSRALAPCSACR